MSRSFTPRLFFFIWGQYNIWLNSIPCRFSEHSKSPSKSETSERFASKTPPFRKCLGNQRQNSLSEYTATCCEVCLWVQLGDLDDIFLARLAKRSTLGRLGYIQFSRTAAILALRISPHPWSSFPAMAISTKKILIFLLQKRDPVRGEVLLSTKILHSVLPLGFSIIIRFPRPHSWSSVPLAPPLKDSWPKHKSVKRTLDGRRRTKELLFSQAHHVGDKSWQLSLKSRVVNDARSQRSEKGRQEGRGWEGQKKKHKTKAGTKEKVKKEGKYVLCGKGGGKNSKRSTEPEGKRSGFQGR